ncbi:uncharacterized protein [Ptychodera flava]|uniref:uncharacterized protein isoform X2 n=1 Tax=Ptychodera flava TaxID=63121 RepID=UPI00396A868D
MNRQRAGSAGIDSKVFRETIARMRQEVLESKAETQRVQDQLNCLIHLVKRAWLGDAAASIHVANIVGVAPPNMTTQEVENDMVAVHAEPKPRVINNWAMLAIGLLNRYYKEKEIEAEEQAKKHLTRRIDYLEELLLHHRNMMNDLPRRSVKTVGDVDRHFIQQRLREQKQREAEEREKQLKRRTPVHHHLYRPVSAKTTDNSNDNYEVDDELISLFLQPSSGIKDTNRTRVTNGTFERTRNVDRFVQPGLFEAGDLIPDREKAKRPSSAKVQQQADMARARPKSAVLPKNERPLKYETTRPVSAKVSSTTTTRAKSAKGPRPNIEPREVAQEKKKAHVYFPVDSSPSLAHKDTVSEDLKRVRQMEEEFKQTTRLLQQRLGIAEDGAI